MLENSICCECLFGEVFQSGMTFQIPNALVAHSPLLVNGIELFFRGSGRFRCPVEHLKCKWSAWWMCERPEKCMHRAFPFRFPRGLLFVPLSCHCETVINEIWYASRVQNDESEYAKQTILNRVSVCVCSVCVCVRALLSRRVKWHR